MLQERMECHENICFETFFETTAETADGHLAIEKGSLETHIKAVIRLDDVELELLESL